MLAAAGLSVMTSPTHIVPVFVGDPERCKEATASTSSRSTIRPCRKARNGCASRRAHTTTTCFDALADALVDVWQRLQLPLNERALAASGSKPFESKFGRLIAAPQGRRYWLARLVSLLLRN